MVPRNSPNAYSMVISRPKLAAVMTKPPAARPMHRTHARKGDSSPAESQQESSVATIPSTYRNGTWNSSSAFRLQKRQHSET